MYERSKPTLRQLYRLSEVDSCRKDFTLIFFLTTLMPASLEVAAALLSGLEDYRVNRMINNLQKKIVLGSKRCSRFWSNMRHQAPFQTTSSLTWQLHFLWLCKINDDIFTAFKELGRTLFVWDPLSLFFSAASTQRGCKTITWISSLHNVNINSYPWVKPPPLS